MRREPPKLGPIAQATGVRLETVPLLVSAERLARIPVEGMVTVCAEPYRRRRGKRTPTLYPCPFVPPTPGKTRPDTHFGDLTGSLGVVLPTGVRA